MLANVGVVRLGLRPLNRGLTTGTRRRDVAIHAPRSRPDTIARPSSYRQVARCCRWPPGESAAIRHGAPSNLRPDGSANRKRLACGTFIAHYAFLAMSRFSSR